MMNRSSIDRRSWIPLRLIALDPATAGEAVRSEGPAVEAIIAAHYRARRTRKSPLRADDKRAANAEPR